MALKSVEKYVRSIYFDGRIVHNMKKVVYFPIKLRFTDGFSHTGNKGISFRVYSSCADFTMIEPFYAFETDRYGITRPVHMPAGKYSILIANKLKVLRKL